MCSQSYAACEGSCWTVPTQDASITMCGRNRNPELRLVYVADVHEGKVYSRDDRATMRNTDIVLSTRLCDAG